MSAVAMTFVDSADRILRRKAMRVIRTIVLILVAIGALAPLARPSDFN